MNTQEHWQTVYTNKQPNEVSWTQEIPQTSLDFIKACNVPKTAKIIDIGGGDSKLVDFLLQGWLREHHGIGYFCRSTGKSKEKIG
jgi:hypothetical protein